MAKNKNLKKKIAAVVAGSMLVLSPAKSDQTESPKVNDQTDHKQLITNKKLKPQIMLIPNVENPEESIMFQHRSHSSHSSHSSHRSHSSHYSSGGV